MVNRVVSPLFVTGCAGFIGFHLCQRLLKEGYSVVGLDNLSGYYNPALKRARLGMLNELGLDFYENDLCQMETLNGLFQRFRFRKVLHLAAQAGVRYSKSNPNAYTSANIEGFLNILEVCRHFDVDHLLYASSSSVYGANKSLPCSLNDTTDHPVSLYGATKKANEVMAHSYAWMYGVPITGLRFFTVYGPWGRPDMALYTFADAILSDRPVQLYNYGDMQRDFTFIGDVIECIIRLAEKPPGRETGKAPASIYNIGNNSPADLRMFLKLIEKNLGRKARVELLPLQVGDVLATAADTSELDKYIGFRPSTPLEVGIKVCLDWYVNYRLQLGASQDSPGRRLD